MKKIINTIIVDDDNSAMQKLQEDLSLYPEIKVIATASSAEAVIPLITKNQPDLLFLDIEMSGMSGLELLNEIKDNIETVRIVFYTAYNKYLKDAIRVSAFDYLQKPYFPEELSLIINRFQTNTPSDKENIEHSIRTLLQHENKFAVQTITGLMLVKCQEVLLFQYLKDQRCWQMRFSDNNTYKLRTNITAKDLIMLNPSFIQINQNCIINLSYLMSIENKTLKCMFYPPFDSIELEVSSRYFKKIRDRLDIL